MSKLADIAMYHYYLTDEILKKIPSIGDADSIGDFFGVGQDCFVLELYAYSEVFYQVIDEAYNEGKQSFGVAVYDIPTSLADWFWETVTSQKNIVMEATYPNIDEFKLEVERHI